jgi:hypothetical protein
MICPENSMALPVKEMAVADKAPLKMRRFYLEAVKCLQQANSFQLKVKP